MITQDPSGPCCWRGSASAFCFWFSSRNISLISPMSTHTYFSQQQRMMWSWLQIFCACRFAQGAQLVYNLIISRLPEKSECKVVKYLCCKHCASHRFCCTALLALISRSKVHAVSERSSVHFISLLSAFVVAPKWPHFLSGHRYIVFTS